MKIQTGEKELLESRTFLALGLGETVISIGEGKESLEFILNFVKVEGEKKPEVKLETPDPDKKTLKFTLTNWNNPLGTGFTEALEVGTYNKRRLLLRSSSIRPELRRNPKCDFHTVSRREGARWRQLMSKPP